MNERHLYDDDFERLLKEKVDQYKMYPSDRVWNQVNSSLHTRRRRFIAGMSVLIGGFLVMAGSQLISPSSKLHPETTVLKAKVAEKSLQAADLQSSGLSGFVAGTLPNAKNQGPTGQGSDINSPFGLNSLGSLESQPLSIEHPETESEKMYTPGQDHAVRPTPGELSAKTVPSISVASPAETDLSLTGSPVENTLSAELIAERTITHLSHPRNDRFSWEIYITPTLNTHYLTGLNVQNLRQSLQNAPIMVVRFANVNGFVDNTPAMGYNLGGNIVYKLSKNIYLKAGLEFSYSRYYIKAYNSNPSQSSTTLSPYLGYIPDSLLNYNAGNGILNSKNPTHYQNKYYQLSVPIGVEMKVAGSGKLQLHLGATIQPSYLLNADSYVLTEDYSYTKNPPVFRRWNLNAGAEAFVSYGVGKIRWELGPQVRYQIFSTYKSNYPFSENMLNYGIRIGFSKTIW